MIEAIKKIKWKGISIFPEQTGYLLVLLCENEYQSNQLFDLMQNNEFKFLFGDSEGNSILLVLNFVEKNISASLPMKEDKIFRHFEGGFINSVTTGFEVGTDGIACNPGRIDILDGNYGRKN